MAEMPSCNRCGKQHWRFQKCATTGAPLFIHRRPREGFREFGDRLDPTTVRVGQTTFGASRAGKRHGELIPPSSD